MKIKDNRNISFILLKYTIFQNLKAHIVMLLNYFPSNCGYAIKVKTKRKIQMKFQFLFSFSKLELSSVAECMKPSHENHVKCVFASFGV